jgi:hypothetical protein
MAGGTKMIKRHRPVKKVTGRNLKSLGWQTAQEMRNSTENRAVLWDCAMFFLKLEKEGL